MILSTSLQTDLYGLIYRLMTMNYIVQYIGIVYCQIEHKYTKINEFFFHDFKNIKILFLKISNEVWFYLMK